MKTKLLLTLGGVIALLAGIGFYWFQVRPAKIKHDCSWVEEHHAAVEGKEGKNEDQLRAEGLIKDCDEFGSGSDSISGVLPRYAGSREECEFQNRKTIILNKEVKPEPERTETRKATDEEYKFCLHNKGL